MIFIYIIGNSRIITPSLDSLADESILFDNYFSQRPLYGSSRADIFTGCRPL